MTGWKYFFPDEGEEIDDARDFPKTETIFDADDAAQVACERDYSEHDGWERGDRVFVIAVVSPDGDVHKFKAWHEPSVEHRVSETV